eukprot:TRINITY_DN7332_c0_g1_i3.p1 TRINITY_DN7332_c0_g1~~TRINITY_DN7332_c0_g1_i3.p1  ORF type:complete len:1279 (-),score=415.43 TRINITY_DN7332_c0_g1_i3:45-3881(-)
MHNDVVRAVLLSVLLQTSLEAVFRPDEWRGYTKFKTDLNMSRLVAGLQKTGVFDGNSSFAFGEQPDRPMVYPLPVMTSSLASEDHMSELCRIPAFSDRAKWPMCELFHVQYIQPCVMDSGVGVASNLFVEGHAVFSKTRLLTSQPYGGLPNVSRNDVGHFTTIAVPFSFPHAAHAGNFVLLTLPRLARLMRVLPRHVSLLVPNSCPDAEALLDMVVDKRRFLLQQHGQAYHAQRLYLPVDKPRCIREPSNMFYGRELNRVRAMFGFAEPLPAAERKYGVVVARPAHTFGPTVTNRKELWTMLTAKFATNGVEWKEYDDSAVGVKDAIELFRRARIVVGAHGPELGHVVWCAPATPVVEIAYSIGSMPSTYYAASVALGLAYHLSVGAGSSKAVTANLTDLSALVSVALNPQLRAAPEFGTEEEFAAHLPVLAASVGSTQGGVFEMGSSKLSTGFLHGVSLSGRTVVTADTDAEWLASIGSLRTPSHAVQHVPVFSDNVGCPPPVKPNCLANASRWDEVGNDRKWAVVFLSHRPPERRREDAVRFKHLADLIVVKDTHISLHGYAWSHIAHEYTHRMPSSSSTLLSHRSPGLFFAALCELFNVEPAEDVATHGLPTGELAHPLAKPLDVVLRMTSGSIVELSIEQSLSRALHSQSLLSRPLLTVDADRALLKLAPTSANHEYLEATKDKTVLEVLKSRSRQWSLVVHNNFTASAPQLAALSWALFNSSAPLALAAGNCSSLDGADWSAMKHVYVYKAPGQTACAAIISTQASLFLGVLKLLLDNPKPDPILKKWHYGVVVNGDSLDAAAVKALVTELRTSCAKTQSHYGLYFSASQAPDVQAYMRSNPANLHIEFVPCAGCDKDSEFLNLAAEAAFDDGVDYIFTGRSIGVTQFDLLPLMMKSLQSHQPPNTGYSGHACSGIMVHRTHMDIFQTMFPDMMAYPACISWVRQTYPPDYGALTGGLVRNSQDRTCENSASQAQRDTEIDSLAAYSSEEFHAYLQEFHTLQYRARFASAPPPAWWYTVGPGCAVLLLTVYMFRRRLLHRYASRLYALVARDSTPAASLRDSASSRDPPQTRDVSVRDSGSGRDSARDFAALRESAPKHQTPSSPPASSRSLLASVTSSAGAPNTSLAARRLSVVSPKDFPLVSFRDCDDSHLVTPPSSSSARRLSVVSIKDYDDAHVVTPPSASTTGAARRMSVVSLKDFNDGNTLTPTTGAARRLSVVSIKDFNEGHALTVPDDAAEHDTDWAARPLTGSAPAQPQIGSPRMIHKSESQLL